MKPIDWILAVNNALTYCQNNRDRLTTLTTDGAHLEHGGLLSHKDVRDCNLAAAHMVNGDPMPEDD